MLSKSPINYASEGQNSPFMKDCLFVEIIIIFGIKNITMLLKINWFVHYAT